MSDGEGYSSTLLSQDEQDTVKPRHAWSKILVLMAYAAVFALLGLVGIRFIQLSN